ncbi:MAG: HipA domain-containing protein [Bacteroidia bacterium]|nr:HipA domain-containing protein [Bacteroidia bacterium]
MKKEIEVYASWPEFVVDTLIGKLHIDKKGNEEIIAFSYDEYWLEHYENKYHLDPDIYPFRGQQFPKAEKGWFGLFFDSAPDRWGRTLMKRKESILAKKENRSVQHLQESDFLLGVNDFVRSGALRFKEIGSSQFLSEGDNFAIPPLARLRELENWSLRLEDNSEEEKWLLKLIHPGSSLGGARPKASVIDEKGVLWIAKFPSMKDFANIGAWEKVAHTLAQMCGIEVPKTQIYSFTDQGSTFLSQRFDRIEKGGRLHYTSALSLLGRKDWDSDASYLEIVEFILQFGSHVIADLNQLFRRILFNIAISNTDDHLRNHGFILNGSGWKLSPAFDLNPDPRGKSLSLAIDEINRSLDFELILSQAHHFRVNNKEAHLIKDEMLDRISGWRNIASSLKLKEYEIDQMESAFKLN